MSGKDTKKGFSFKEADIDSTVLFISIWRNSYLIIGGSTLMALIAWVVCYWLYPELLVAASENTSTTPRVLSVKIISACFVSGLLLISSMIILSELMTGRALIAPFVEPKTMTADKDKTMGEDNIQEPADVTEQPLQMEMVEGDSNLTVGAFARSLHHLDISRILAISAEGDDGAAVTLELVRELADRGSRVIMVDMTGTGAVSATMLDGMPMAGLTDLLVGRVRFADAIHADHYSEAHVMPLGLAKPEEAMDNEKDLSLIIGALETVYDMVVLECGPSLAQDITALVTQKTQIALTIYDEKQQEIANHAKDLSRNGYQSFIRLHVSGAAVPSTR